MKNETIIQYFEWYLPADSNHWTRVEQEAGNLSRLGITKVWLPPAYKGAAGKNDVGYGVYDMYDLGEFDQKGSFSTKYGTNEQYKKAVQSLHDQGIEAIADVVFNHRMGADACEDVMATTKDDNNRSQQIGDEMQIKAWTKFDFINRGDKYSSFRWNKNHFTGTDWNEEKKQKALFKFVGKEWEEDVDKEKGNYDYLMGADVDMNHPEVIKELTDWGKWYLEETKVDGFRIDAVKHIKFSFFVPWMKEMQKMSDKPLFAVGEYWKPQVSALKHYLDNSGHMMELFDVPLHFNLHNASRNGGHYDMRRIFEGTLVKEQPESSVTFVDNHDTQPGQALQSWVDQWFKPLAYGLTLLRQEGIPCVFYGDLYGIPNNNVPPVGKVLEKLLIARKELAYGDEIDYFDHENVIGWSRLGDKEHIDSGMAVLLSDGPSGSKTMCVGGNKVGASFYDCLENRSEIISIGEDGCGLFHVEGGSISVWVDTINRSKF